MSSIGSNAANKVHAKKDVTREARGGGGGGGCMSVVQRNVDRWPFILALETIVITFFLQKRYHGIAGNSVGVWLRSCRCMSVMGVTELAFASSSYGKEAI